MKQIKRQKNWTTGAIEWDMFADERYIGSRATHAQAERDLDAFVFEALTHDQTSACAGFGCVDGCGDCAQPSEARS